MHEFQWYTTRQRILDPFGVILFLEREKRFSILWWFWIVCDYLGSSLMFTFSSSLVFLATSRVRKGFYSRQQNLKKENFESHTFIIVLSFKGNNKSSPYNLWDDLEKRNYLISRWRKVAFKRTCHCDQYNNEFTRIEFINIVIISAKSSYRVTYYTYILRKYYLY